MLGNAGKGQLGLCVQVGERSYSGQQRRQRKLGAVSNISQGSADQWSEQIMIEHTPDTFRIDIGADVPVMNQKTFNTL